MFGDIGFENLVHVMGISKLFSGDIEERLFSDMDMVALRKAVDQRFGVLCKCEKVLHGF